ncbi:hypothetical protein [Streptomyces sp. NPDC052015]|uniref:hypothetical protein n=1 Tax=Streptomyces sp. NPDC052015 TaxID=3154755 RepID=UPI00341E85E5
MYATLPSAAAADPRRLVAFRKVTLPPAASRRLRLNRPRAGPRRLEGGQLDPRIRRVHLRDGAFVPVLHCPEDPDHRLTTLGTPCVTPLPGEGASRRRRGPACPRNCVESGKRGASTDLTDSRKGVPS